MSYLIACRAHRFLLLAIVVLAGACTTQIYAPAATNPPPSAPFQTFGRVQLKPVVLNPAFADHSYNQSATAAIERNLQATLAPQLQSWDKGSEPTLVIEPYIQEIKFIGGAVRFWAGAFAGSSAVVMRVTYKDAETGATIATPVFYQHASAMGGAWTIGGSDNAMLARVAELIAQYTRDNYVAAVGGSTGAPADRVRVAS